MKTPIVDFLEKYRNDGKVRAHMPGHKGRGVLGLSEFDITEVSGADSLYEASGIIAESEACATEIFGSDTYYSTEGSTQCIKAMLFLASKRAWALGSTPVILAARNAHKSFIMASALIGFEIKWLEPSKESYLFSGFSADGLEALFSRGELPTALYLTSPDYLGRICDVSAAARICKKYGVLLLVDNAHGAYLKFLKESRHPIDLGADMCCDSAHKTLPCLTGGAYLHVSKNAPGKYLASARRMLSLFASTSPSYLILESLDLCNAYLSDGYAEKLCATAERIICVKDELSKAGFCIRETEPLKIVIDATEYGYTGFDIAAHLSEAGIETEFFDGEYLVLMATPENSDSDYERLVFALRSLPKKAGLAKKIINVKINAPKKLSVRDAVFSEHETLPVREAIGRICASPTVSCPPAVPIAVSGEIITEEAVLLFEKHKIYEIEVVKND